MHRFRTVPLLLALLASSSALAQEELVEQVVVRNRLYPSQGRLEVSPVVGFAVLPRLTSHYNLNIGVGYNLTETWGFELRAGYALSDLTGLARSVRDSLAATNPTGAGNPNAVVDELSDLWQMKANGMVGARWMPIYGKVNLVADLPVHFNAYLWAGAGAAQLSYEAIAICRVDASRVCVDPATDSKVSWLGSGAVGMRFYTHKQGALRLEVRDLIYPDAYRVNVDRNQVEAGADFGAVGEEFGSPGLTHLVMFDVGYTFIF